MEIEIDQIMESVEILNLPDNASLNEIKNIYKKLILKWHPDKCMDKNKKKCKEMSQKINEAYNIITCYCNNYKYSFMKENIKKNILNSPDAFWLKRFGDDPIWR